MAERCQSADQFLSMNSVTFVTYNFDRLIEAKLIDGVQEQYGDRIKDPSSFFGQIRVIHLHGSLGPLVLRKHRPVLGLHNINRPLHEVDDIEEAMADPLLDAAKSIQIVSEAQPDTDAFVAARDAIDKAAQLIFLGFGFGKDNGPSAAARSEASSKTNRSFENGNDGGRISLVGSIATARQPHGPIRTDERGLGLPPTAAAVRTPVTTTNGGPRKARHVQ